MNILIFGASGATGHELVKQALNHGHTVTAYVRNPQKLKISHANLILHQGNVADFAAVDNAVKGKDVVISALGAASPFSFDQVVVDGIDNIVTAMEKNGVSRFIYLSFIGVRDSRHDAPLLIRHVASKILKTEIAGHEAKEKIIRKSRLSWTLVRPAGLSNGRKKGVYRFGENLKSGALMVTSTRADVADFMLRQVNDGSYIQKAPRIMY